SFVLASRGKGRQYATVDRAAQAVGPIPGHISCRPSVKTLLCTRIEVHDYPHADQVRQALRLQLLDNVGAVQLDGSKADAELAGDDLVGLARGDQLKDLAFAGCQQSGTGLQRGALETLLVRPIIPVQRPLDTFEQDVLAQSLLDKIERSCLHPRNCQRKGAVASDEDNRDTPAADIELLLQFEPGHLGHPYIEQQAAAASWVVTFEKRARRRKRFHGIPSGSQHKSQPLP